VSAELCHPRDPGREQPPLAEPTATPAARGWWVSQRNCRTDGRPSHICERRRFVCWGVVGMGTAVGKRMCPMIIHCRIWLTTIAAGLLVAGLSATAHARGGGGGHGGANSPEGPAMLRGPGMLRGPAPLRDPAPSAALPQRPASASGPPAAVTRQNALAASSEAQAAAAALAAPTGLAMTPSAATAPLPPSAIGTPETQVPAVAPLSPAPDLVTESSGGASGVDLSAASPSLISSGPSPSESAPSHPGGGGETLADCMGFWDQGTHMSKTEWRTACVRTLNRLDLKP